MKRQRMQDITIIFTTVQTQTSQSLICVSMVEKMVKVKAMAFILRQTERLQLHTAKML